MMETRKCLFIILILAVGVIIAGCNGGPSCSDVGGPCDVDSDCCAGLICGGLHCCYGVGVEVSTESECCSGQINDGVCCAPEGADCEGNCCEGLFCSSTERCVRPQCPPGCYWVPTSATHGSGGYCECVDSHGEIIVIAPEETCVECDLKSVCPDMPLDQYYVMRVSWGSTADECEIVGPFWASSPGRAERCARDLVLACESEHCSVEDVTHELDPSCE